MQAKAAAEGTPKVPLRGGFRGQRVQVQHANQSFEEASSFVFAYQCNKINYFPWKRMAAYLYGQTASSETQGNDTSEKEDVLKVEVACPVKPVEFGADDDADDVLQHTIMIPSEVEGNETEVEVKYISAVAQTPLSSEVSGGVVDV